MSKRTNPKLSMCHQYFCSQQQGNGSLQTIFWIVGIIVGLLSIAQFVIPYIQSNQPDDAQVASGDNTEDLTPVDSSDVTQDETSEQPILPDSPSTKVGNFTAYDNGVVVDEAMGIMWMRCSLGQDWNGTNCQGEADTFDYEEAIEALEQINKVSYIGLSGWQLPDIEALHSLLYCSEGYKDSYEIPVRSGEKTPVEVGCTGNYIKPAIKANVFPDTYWSVWSGYWSSSRNEENEPLILYFNSGEIKAKNKAHYVRAMRYLN